MRGELHGADRAVRAEVMRNRLVQHRVTDEEMPVRDLADRLAIPRIAQHREHGPVVRHRSTDTAPVDALYLLHPLRRNINRHLVRLLRLCFFLTQIHPEILCALKELCIGLANLLIAHDA